MNEWQLMDTAPKDGTEIIVYLPDFGSVCAAWFSEETGLWPSAGSDAYDSEWQPVNVGLPSHWMPLPDYPTP